ncbi:hypothetical protein UFOVP1649_3 [uncultured Caudovirales phage]|uniref:Uncharacterized protein n=1 Tax=uncultured Caudovirales phage TaxID=2100421 RepID=A0A6J5T325_9CAUD|nr:hypothetical protein UFOVP1649_3 [uncultured Caudovirales phage]
MAAGATYTPIASYTVSGSSTTSYTFSSIPATYTDIIAIYSTSVSGGGQTSVQFNGDTATNYSQTQLYGLGSGSGGSNRNTNNTSMLLGWDSPPSGFSTNILHVMNYSNSTTYKTCLARRNSADYLTAALVGLWRSTSAVNAITFSSGIYVAGSTFALYGITAA